jgi:hypothetical protein
VLTRTATGRRTADLYQGCCAEIAWARPHRLVFTGDGGYSAYILDPATLESFAFGFSNVYASPDGRWVLGDVYADDIGGDEPNLGGLVSVATGRCFAVPGDDLIGPVDSPGNTGFTPDGSAVVVERGGNTWRYPISSLRQPCGAQIENVP